MAFTYVFCLLFYELQTGKLSTADPSVNVKIPAANTRGGS